MRRLYETFIQYRFLILAFFTILAILGYRAYKEIPVDAFPDITPKQVIIYTESPGNPPQMIEKLITYPIESSMAGLPGVKLIMSNSIFGLSYVSIFFEDKYDIYFLRQLVSERLANVDIPKELGKPVLGPNTTGLGQVFWYSIEDSTKKYSLAKLREIQEYVVAPLLKSIDGVEEVVSWGGFEKQYEAQVDPKKLQAVGVTYEDVIEALQRTNISAGGQYIAMNKEQYIIRGAGFYKNLDQIARTVIKSQGIKSVTVADVAKVVEGRAPRFGAVTIDGQERMFGMVLQRSGTNAAKVVERIKQKLPKIDQALPKGVHIRPIYDRSQITKKAVHTMTSALISGAILVIVVLLLFMFELRSAFIVVLSLPISLLLAFLAMRYFGISANLMSLSGLAIAIGMIVDATIVVVENAFRLLHSSKEEKSVIIAQAAASVTKPVVFAILIIIAVFSPLIWLGGLAGKLYAPMAIDIIFVMIASILVALVLVPVLAYLLLKPTKRAESPLISFIKKLYVPVLEFVLRYPKTIVTTSFVIFVFLAVLVSGQGREFMPKLNEESIMYRVIAIPGTALEQSVELSKKLEHFIKANFDEAKSVLAMIGRSEKGETAGTNYMEILVDVKQGTDTKALEERMTKRLQERFDYVQFVPTQPIAMRIEELLEGVKAELAIKIYGSDQRILGDLAKKVEALLHKVKGLKSSEIESQLGQAQIIIEPNYNKMARLGIKAQEIMDVVRHVVGEEPVSVKFEGVKKFPIVVKVADARRSIENLENLLIRSYSGAVARLKDVADIRIQQGPSFIKRENLSRYIVISFDVEGRDIASFVKEADSLIRQKIDFPTGYYYQWAGDFKNMQEATKRLAFIIPSIVGIVFLLLYTAFGSVKKSIIILLGVPLGLIGAFAALLIADIYISIAAIIGFIVIFAIAILNGIVLVSFIEEVAKKFEHVKILDLVKEATLLRLRPVLMTAATTFFGIVPLLFAKGVGSEIQYPLAVVVTGGIVTSTFVTLVVLPALYLLFYRKES